MTPIFFIEDLIVALRECLELVKAAIDTSRGPKIIPSIASHPLQIARFLSSRDVVGAVDSSLLTHFCDFHPHSVYILVLRIARLLCFSLKSFIMAISNYIHPSTYSSLSEQEISVVQQIHDFAEKYFQDPRFDASHDFDHVKRVVTNALAILEKEEDERKRRALPALNPMSVILGALLHDVEDKKYIIASDQKESPMQKAIIDAGMPDGYAEQMQLLVEGVSYSSEVKNPQRVKLLIEAIPELAVVQDADRLDAIGAIGIGRCFTFGGAKGARSLENSIQHFEEKLLKLEGMMKTATGKAMAAERSSRIREFMAWWHDENGANGQ